MQKQKHIHRQRNITPSLHTIPRRDPTDQDYRSNSVLRHLPLDLHQVATRERRHATVYLRSRHESSAALQGRSAVKSSRPVTRRSRCMVDSDRTCKECQAGLEQFAGISLNLHFPDKHLGGVTYGGYSDSIVVDKVHSARSSNLNLAGVAPLLCAESPPTRHAPLGRHEGKRSAVVGLGARSWA